jgi:hypothetical protein
VRTRKASVSHLLCRPDTQGSLQPRLVTSPHRLLVNIAFLTAGAQTDAAMQFVNGKEPFGILPAPAKAGEARDEPHRLYTYRREAYSSGGFNL